MNIEDFAYIVETEKNLDDAVVSVLKAVEQKGWALFQIYDVKERLAAKGFEQKPLKIIEICSGKHANNFLNKNRLISLCMPCKINVLEEDDKVKIVGMNPRVISEFFPEVNPEEAEEVEKDIKEIVDNARWIRWWIMVSLEKHIQISLKRTGKEYREVHEWLDGKHISYKERLSRHNISNIQKLLPVVEKRFGKDGVREYIQHIKDDCNNNILVRMLIMSKILRLKIKV